MVSDHNRFRRLVGTRRDFSPRLGWLALAAVPLALAGCGAEAKRHAAHMPVTVAIAEARDAPYSIAASGTVEARHTAAISSPVGGTLQRVLFREGDDVSEGQALFELDPRPFEAALQQAIATQARDEAQAVIARSNAERSRALSAQNLISQQEMDAAVANEAASRAAVRADSALVSTARLNLDYCTVRAPISGRSGKLLVHVGDLVKANSPDLPMVVINELRPILVRFAVPQSDLPALMSHRDSNPPVFVNRGGADSTWIQGQLTFVDNAVDAATGTVLLKAEFENRDAGLWPGAFVNARLQLYTEHGACVVPTPAVMSSQSGAFVYVVGADSTVSMRPVRVERAFEEWSVITHGITPGERVVTDGQLRLTPGATVYWRDPAREPGQRRGGQLRRRHEWTGLDRHRRRHAVNLSGIFIQRPIMTTLVMIGILMFGILAYQQLPVSDLPNVDYPVISVNAALPGASPETMASAVATPLERQFSTIAGIDAMTSSSSQGNTSITLQFTLDRSIDAAAQDVQSAIAKTLRTLPSGILAPSYQKVNPADSPIIYLALTSSSMPLSDLDEYAEGFLAQRISTVKGVAQVSVYGSQKYAVRIQLDPQALSARGIGIDEVADAVSSGNVNMPTGILWGAHKALTVQASGQLQSAPEFRSLVVSYRNGQPVRLGDLGQVLDDVQDNHTASWFNGTRAIVLAVQRQPGTNTVAVADGVKQLMERLRSQLPGAVDLNVLYDRSISIRRSVHDVQFTLLLTLALVVLVIFLFLRNLSATLIPSLALPLSVVGTFAAMQQLGYSIDNLSLMALTLSVGFVVDDAIVMLENIVRHMEMGKTPMQAAYDGSREIGFTILSMTLSLTAVFIPVLFMGGLLGRLFHEFAVTISVAILVSGFVSLTLTPMMASRFLKPGAHQSHGRLYLLIENGFASSLRAYERTLAWVMDHRRTALAVSGAIVVGTVLLFQAVPKGFIPSEDNSQIFGTTETAEGTSFDDMREHQQQLAALVLHNPSVEAMMSSIGAGGPGGTGNQGRIMLRLKPRSEREGRKSADQLVRELQPRLAVVPGIRIYLQIPPSVRVGGRLTKSLYQFTLQSPDIASLYQGATTLESKLKTEPLLENVTSDLQIKNPQVAVQIDRDHAAALGVTPQQIEEALYDAYGSRQVSTIYTPNDQYWVIVELLPQFQRDVDALRQLSVRSSNGSLVPVSAVATLSSGLGPLTVNHAGQIPCVTLSFDLKPGSSLSQAVDAVNRTARETLPSNVTTSFAGTAQAFQDSQRGLLFLLIIAVLVIYLVLGILYESFIHPLTILSGLPFAGFGALLTLLIFRTELSVYAFVGVIMLIGLVKKNAIMMIDFALDAEREEGLSPRDAIVKACSVRFRPIMMTTMAALMGTLPIAIGFGAGSESRRPLGLAVVGGLAFSQVITLYITPVVYTYLDRFQKRFSANEAPVVREAAGAATLGAPGE